MSKQFTAYVAARTIKGQSKTFSYAARDDLYTCDDDEYSIDTIAVKRGYDGWIE